MPKPNEFEVHTMGGNMSGGNQVSDKSQGISNDPMQASQDAPSQQAPFSSQLSKSSSMGGGISGGQSQGGPSQPFTGAPTSSNLGNSNGNIGKAGNGSGIQTMGGIMQEDDLSGGSSKKLLKIFIGVFVVIVLVGGAIFGVSMLKDKEDLASGDLTEEVVEEDLGLNTEVADSSTTEVLVETEPKTTTTKVRYSDELLNYLSIDVESESVFTDIENELDIIRKNLPSQNFSEPITFIITNKQNKPISFSDFSVKANMNIPGDVLLALDDRFELYAFNDFSAGVRFGFRVDVKNETALLTALEAESSAIPATTMVFFKDFKLDDASEMTFKDGTYKEYSVKYLNLNATETNSVDYVIDGDQWVLGTSQKTLRSILDKLDKNKESSTAVDGEEIVDAEADKDVASSTKSESSSDEDLTTQSDESKMIN